MSNNNYKQIAEKYQELSIAYQLVYEDTLRDMDILSQLQGVYVEIRSECIKYTVKTKKVAVAPENRLKIISKVIDRYDYLLNEKHRQNHMIKILASKYADCKKENEELKKQLKSVEQAWKEEV